MKFRKGDRVYIPTTKSVEGWGGIETSISVANAIENKCKFMYVNGFDSEENAYMVDWFYDNSENSSSGDYFAESDLIKYV